MGSRAFGWRNNTPAVELYSGNQDDEQPETLEEQHLHNEIVESKLKIADEMAAVADVGELIKLPLDDIEIEPPIDWEVELPMVVGDHDLMVIGKIGSVATLQVCGHSVAAAD